MTNKPTRNLYQLFTYSQPVHCYNCAAQLLQGVGYCQVYAPLNSLQLAMCAACASEFCRRSHEYIAYPIVLTAFYKDESGHMQAFQFPAFRCIVTLKP